jgi:hypothetical protein
MLPKPNSIGNSRMSIASLLRKLALCVCVILCGHLAHAQVPTNQLHFAFDEATGTNTISDTSLNPSAVVTSLGLFNAAGTGMVNLHGAAGTGVSGAVNGNRALDFTPDLTPSQTNQPANSGVTVINGSTINGGATGNAVGAFDLNDGAFTNLGNAGLISSFVGTIWIKLNAPIPNGETVCPRIWILNQGATGADTGNGGNLNQIGLKFQQNNQLAFSFAKDNPTLLATIPSGTFPTNKWLFFAVIYDGTNSSIYYGSETSTAQLIGTAATPGKSCNITGSGCLALGNRHTGATANQRGLDGWIDDFRLYTGGVGTAAFVEDIRDQALGGPPGITGIYPDGLMLQEATNQLVFTGSSPAGSWGPSTNIASAQLVVNGVDVSAQLTSSGPGTNVTYSYTGLPQNLPAVTANITVTDARGVVSTASVTFDTFSGTNFTWEAEEFDFFNPNVGLSGQFLDDALYTSFATNDVLGNPLSYFGLDSTELIDTHKGTGNGGLNASDYRAGATDATKTQTPAAAGELARLKFINNPDTNAVDHMIGNTSNPDWQNYTKTFPAGLYNVYGRFSGGSGTVPVTLALVTSGRGTTSQTTSNLGTFNFTAGNFSYAVLRDSFGNLATVNLGGTNTVRTTWGSGGQANFYMLVPANTNLPSITGVYPDGLVLFEPTNKLVFTASSSVTTINTNSIHLSLNGTDVSSNLVFSGSPSTWNVSYTGLSINAAYTAVINVTDANGGNASSTIKIDTYNPVLQVEGEDFDFDPSQSPVPSGTGLRYIDNPVPSTNALANSYFGQVGNELIDENGNNNGNPLNSLPGYNTDNYRVNDRTMTSLLLTDGKRAQFLATGASDYNLGFMGNGFWQEYTRTWPAGTFNVYARIASGNGGTVHIRADQIIAGWGTTNQLLLPTQVGTFNCPANGGYGNYLYVPMLDRFGNYANLTLGGTNTFRMTVDNPININFYMLLAARTDLPRIDSVYPDGSTLMQRTNMFSFVASSPTYGINTTNIHVTLNGVSISSSLLFSGSATSWNVSYPGLLPNTSYTATISITDTHSQSTATTVSFDTFSAVYFTWEAEDFDFGGGQYIDNPVPGSPSNPTNSYYNQVSTTGIDQNYVTYQGTHLYRPSDFIATEFTSDAPRLRYLNAQQSLLDSGIQDYDVYDWVNTSWINYTHTYPTGSFHVYARLSAGNGAFNLQCAQVTGGWGTMTQTTSYLGTFKGTGASFATWQYVPLVNTNTSQLVTLSLGGTNTFQMTADGNENANFYMLVPVAQAGTLTATPNGPNLALSFATQTGFTYTVQYKNNLTDATWATLGSVSGDGTVKSLNDTMTQSSRFYRLAVQ